MRPVILDTDIGTDSDDAGALMVLHSFVREGAVDPLCITSCTSRRDGAAAVDAINRWYGKRIEVGQWKEPFHDTPEHGAYSRAIDGCCENDFRKVEAPAAVPLWRKKLAAAKEKVTCITIGPLNVIAALLRSASDEYSPLTGEALLQAKAESFYIMGGRFDCASPEWNIAADIPSAQAAVHALCALSIPTVFLPWEAGARVKTGVNALLGPYSPMRLAYYVHNNGPRESWDPLTVYAALCGDGLALSPNGTVTVDGEGVTRFTAGDGSMRYVTAAFDAEYIRKQLEDRMRP